MQLRDAILFTYVYSRTAVVTTEVDWSAVEAVRFHGPAGEDVEIEENKNISETGNYFISSPILSEWVFVNSLAFCAFQFLFIFNLQLKCTWSLWSFIATGLNQYRGAAIWSKNVLLREIRIWCYGRCQGTGWLYGATAIYNIWAGFRERQ